MDRRQYLGLTGTSIVALLGGCSSSGSQSTATATDTATDTATATATSTATATETATPTETATATPASDPFNVDRPYLEFIREEYLPSGEQARKIQNNFNKGAVNMDSAQAGEQVLKQMANIPGVNTGTSWRAAYDTARSAQYAVTELLDQPIDPEDSNSVHVMPVPLVITGKNKHGVDFHDSHGRTTMAAAYGETTDGNILNPEEDGIGGNEGLIGATTRVSSDGAAEDGNFRWSHYDVIEARKNVSFTATAVDWYHTQIGKLIPDFYPAGKVPAQPQAWMTESGAKLLDEKVIENYEGYTPFVEMRRGFEDKVDAGKLGRIYEENGEFAVKEEDQEAYRNDILFAPEP